MVVFFYCETDFEQLTGVKIRSSLKGRVEKPRLIGEFLGLGGVNGSAADDTDTTSRKTVNARTQILFAAA